MTRNEEDHPHRRAKPPPLLERAQGAPKIGAESERASRKADMEKLEIQRSPSGYFVVRNRGKLAEVPEVVARARTRDDAERIAVEVLRMSRKRIARKREIIERVLLAGVKSSEWSGRWVVSELDFKKCLARVENEGFGVYGIEAWRPKRRPRVGFELCGIRVHEQQGKSPMDPSWYKAAFKELASKCPRARFHCTVAIPEEVLDHWGLTPE